MHHLNARNLMCPLPVIRTQNKVKELATGEQLTIACSDPGALNDIPAWCRINGHTLISAEDDGDDITVVIEVGAA